MSFEIGKEYFGFKVVDGKHLELENVDVLYFEHIRSGAKLVHYDTPSTTKGFSVHFKTYAMNDTGIAHILEHCLLCGSRKYRTRNPFEKFIKQSRLSTYNGHTCADFTYYEVTSKDDKDFFTLTDMVMDGVFYPLVCDDEKIFLQEGWRYDINEETGEVSHNGIVYNEVKVAESNPFEAARFAMNKLVFPNTHYACCHYGVPSSIVNLTHSELVDFYKKYYKADNALISISGKVDLSTYLEFLDKEYLSAFEKTGQEYDAPVEVVLPECRKHTQATFPALAGNSSQGGNYHKISFYLPKDVTSENMEALNTVFEYLTEESKGSIKRALEAEGIVADVKFGNLLDLKYPVYELFVYGCTTDEITKVEQRVYDVFNDIVQNGIDKDFIDCKRNNTLFENRKGVADEDYSHLLFPEFTIPYWLWGRESIEEVNAADKYEWLRSDIAKEYYGSLVQRFLLNNKNVSVVSVLPAVENDGSPGEEFQPALSDEEMQAYTEKYRAFQEWQNAPSDDVPKNYDEDENDLPNFDCPVKYEVEDFKDNAFVYVKEKSNGIVYLEWWYNISHVEPELIPYISLHNLVLWDCDSLNYPLSKKKLDFAKYIGEMEYRIRTVNNELYLTVKVQVLQENLDDALDAYAKAIADIKNISAYDLQGFLRRFFNYWGYACNCTDEEVAEKRLWYYFFPEKNSLDELNTFNFLMVNHRNFSEEIGEIASRIAKVNERIFQNSSFRFGYLCDTDEHEVIKRKVGEFNNALNYNPLQAVEENILDPAPNEGLIVENDSHSLAFGVSLSVLPEDLRAAMKFLVNILNRQYIYENVRLRGGAYVCNAKFENGTLLLTSRRDPDIWKTYEIFNGVPDWLETLDITQADIKQQNRFIADLGGLTKEQLLTEAIWNNVTGTEENLTFGMAKAVSELKVDSIELLKKILKIAFEDRVICAVASEEVIMAKADLFEQIVDLRSGI